MISSAVLGFLILFKARRMLVETLVRVWNLAHLRFSSLKADLLKRAHFVFGLLLQNKNSEPGGTGRHQLESRSTIASG